MMFCLRKDVNAAMKKISVETQKTMNGGGIDAKMVWKSVQYVWNCTKLGFRILSAMSSN